MEVYKGMIVKDYKKDMLSCNPQNSGKYLYKVLTKAKHEETGEEMVVYQSLFGEFEILVCSTERFNEKVKQF